MDFLRRIIRIKKVSQFSHPKPSIFDAPQRQYFSLPFGLISYITQNPISVDGLLKLQKSCKYFFSKNKIIVVNKLVYIQNNQFLQRDTLKKGGKCLKQSKYWLNHDLIICKDGSLNLLKAIYHCTLKALRIYEQNLTLDEFDFLVDDGKNITWLYLNCVNIRNKNCAIVTCDQILAKVPNISWFYYNCKNEIFTSKTFEIMNALKIKSKLQNFQLFIHNLSADADISLICKFIEYNTHTFFDSAYIRTSTFFGFYLNMSNARIQKDVLQNAIDNMLVNMEVGIKPLVWVH